MKNIVHTYQKFILIPLGILCFHVSQAQSDEKTKKRLEGETKELLRTAEEQLGDNDFASAEASYREAVAKSPENVTAKYNMANMYYTKEKTSQATGKYKQAASVAETKEAKHEVFHNLGNAYMKQKKYQEAVEAYKNALRNNPTDDETRYNLALAKKMLEKEKEDNKDGGGDDDKKDQDKNQDEKNKDKGDKGDQDKDKNEGDKKEDQGGDQKDDQQKEPEKPDDEGKPKDQKDKQDQNGEKQPQDQQPQPGQLSPQQIKSLLEAMNNEEKKVQDKINAQKAKGAKTRTEKDW